MIDILPFDVGEIFLCDSAESSFYSNFFLFFRLGESWDIFGRFFVYFIHGVNSDVVFLARGRIFSQAENKLWVSSFLARNELFKDFPLYLVHSWERAHSQTDRPLVVTYTSCLAGNELVPSLTKNTASGFYKGKNIERFI